MERETVYVLVIDGLKLPRTNVVIRWSRRERIHETKRIRNAVVATAAATGLTDVKPLARAKVRITAFGRYSRRDATDGTWFKDALDSIVARWVCEGRVGKIKIKLPKPVRRWGFIEDDSPRVIGKAVTETRPAKKFYLAIRVKGAGA